MRSAVVTLLVAAIAASPAAAATQTPKPRKCASVEYTRESGYLVFSSTSIRALKVRCSRARRLARPAPRAAKSRRYRADGFACRGTRANARSIAFTCKRKRMRVTFVWTEK